MIKIIFSDMDGTLLDENGELPEEFPEVIAELKKRGVIFAPSSGRQYFALLEQMGEYKNEFMFLAENGAFNIYKEKEICSSVLDMDLVHRVIAEADKHHFFAILCGKKNAYARKEWEPYIHEARRFFTHSIFVDSFDDVDDEFVKIAFADCEGLDAEHNLMPVLTQFEPEQQVSLSSNYWVDILNPGINKGWAIKHIQERFGFKPEECAAFGDYMNDAEMMSSVYYSYAMANAHPKVKELARFEAKSNAEHGVMVQIRELLKSGLCGEKKN